MAVHVSERKCDCSGKKKLCSPQTHMRCLCLLFSRPVCAAPSFVCSAILISMAEGVSRDVQRDVLLHQHVAYQLAPCMVTVLSTQGCILTQNAESVAWLGCRSKEHSLCISPDARGKVPSRGLHQCKDRPTEEDPDGEPHQVTSMKGESQMRTLRETPTQLDPLRETHKGDPPRRNLEETPTKENPRGETHKGQSVLPPSKTDPCGPSQVCYLKELFYDQEDLMVKMHEVLADHVPFVERTEIRSPLLRAWMGAGENEEVWHRVHIIRIEDPITLQPQFCLSQMDVTNIVQAERHVQQLQQQQSALLKEILPQQVVEHLLTRRRDVVDCKSTVC
ncbi:hypothetical protein DUNSADRAFT_9773 [Dunaliella salina]|uniref:Uncharacterized protein n=1 Tax=Dunaliella salina TaxID=3046 RepID=A0ABQ7GGQ7_DUNSA|nr:hypothetical protein DUNSADRAFT_9773 [Dunaliella salina]|eukprot:KAF5833788.1 hypothetical protein DUNSADRAFT_9773 [Dunaliella salina]